MFVGFCCSDRYRQLTLQFASSMQSGQKERLKTLLKERLVECGWRDAVKDEASAQMTLVYVALFI